VLLALVIIFFPHKYEFKQSNTAHNLLDSPNVSAVCYGEQHETDGNTRWWQEATQADVQLSVFVRPTVWPSALFCSYGARGLFWWLLLVPPGLSGRQMAVCALILQSLDNT